MKGQYNGIGSGIIRLVGAIVALAGASLFGISTILGTARQQAYPDSWLLYDVLHADSFEMYRMNPDNRSIMTLSSGNYFFYPVGSPNGAQFAFWGWKNKRWHLYQMRINGGQLRMVMANQRNLLPPSWSQDGRTVQLYLTPSGLTRDSYVRTDSNPVVSPDGQWLAFTSRRIPCGLYRMRLDHSEVQLIVADSYITDYSLTWSPDGEWIGYVSRQGGETAIYRARVDGSQVERLTAENMPYRRLSWMPSANLPFHAAFLLVSGLGMLVSGWRLFKRQSQEAAVSPNRHLSRLDHSGE